MKQYRAYGYEILDEKGSQVCVILQSSCTKKLRNEITKYVVEKLNAAEMEKEISKATQPGGV